MPKTQTAHFDSEDLRSLLRLAEEIGDSDPRLGVGVQELAIHLAQFNGSGHARTRAPTYPDSVNLLLCARRRVRLVARCAEKAEAADLRDAARYLWLLVVDLAEGAYSDLASEECPGQDRREF